MFDDDYEYDRDQYDEYEDYVLETGDDPYHLFDELYDINRVTRLLGYIRVAKLKLRALWWRVRGIFGGFNDDDIPF